MPVPLWGGGGGGVNYLDEYFTMEDMEITLYPYLLNFLGVLSYLFLRIGFLFYLVLQNESENSLDQSGMSVDSQDSSLVLDFDGKCVLNTLFIEISARTYI